MFVAGNDNNIYSEITLDKNKKTEGKNSLNINYSFLEKRKGNTVNISFNNNIHISEQSHGVAILVYPMNKSNGAIGVTIKYKENKTYKLSFTNHFNWNGLRILSVEVPKDISYPAVIERLYIDSIYNSERLNGKVLIDNL